jgi:hypothetical protein
MSEQDPARGDNVQPPAVPIAAIFAWELAIFICGLLGGFFWHLYFTQSGNDPQVHIIIGLSVVVICLWRYIGLFRRRYARGADAE